MRARKRRQGANRRGRFLQNARCHGIYKAPMFLSLDDDPRFHLFLSQSQLFETDGDNNPEARILEESLTSPLRGICIELRPTMSLLLPPVRPGVEFNT